MADIFISYKRAERSRVEQIAMLFREEKFDVWFDSKLEVGRDEGFQSQIEREVTSAGTGSS
ncbi:MAG TPA: TIR domain-containing protein [Chitinophagaceae bacterium]|nr:TIR domain-containing protein [Chitinophagaceae bacterium]